MDVNNAGQLQDPVYEVDNALIILVRNAIEEFGFAPRDVYDGVLRLPSTRKQHTVAVENLSSSDLKTLVETFSKNRALTELSHHIVAVYPLPSLPNIDDWAIDFTSISIGRKVVELVRLEEDKELQHISDFLHKIPEGSTLAGWIFEARAYRILSRGWRSGEFMLQPIPMISNCLDPPTFSNYLDPSCLHKNFFLALYLSPIISRVIACRQSCYTSRPYPFPQ